MKFSMKKADSVPKRVGIWGVKGKETLGKCHFLEKDRRLKQLDSCNKRERKWRAHKRKVKKNERNNTSHPCSAARQGHSRTDGGDDQKKTGKISERIAAACFAGPRKHDED